MHIKAFVSSTYKDLWAHRQHVIRTLRAAGITVDPMEDWTADTDAPKRLSQNRVKGCHLCILLVAFRRGDIPEGEDRSVTQLEYEYAISHGIDVLVFLLRDDAPWPAVHVELATDPLIRAWRDDLRRRHVVSEFGLEASSVRVQHFLEREAMIIRRNAERWLPHKWYADSGLNQHDGCCSGSDEAD